jgi:predicted KAP-like P-loop ATPase
LPADARWYEVGSDRDVGAMMAVAEARTRPAASADRPLVDPREDRLGYAPFARALADGICAMSAPDGLVVGIYGAWGLGKTTVLNFVEHYLHERRPGQFDVIRFNPWWFSGRVDIAAAFFDQLRGAFVRWQGDGDVAKRHVERLARVVGAETGLRIGDGASEAIGYQSFDVPELKRELAKALGDQHRRLLIVIDDIDRLSRDEVAELFAVVKALADLPNVLYLLAFDRDQVTNALRDRSGQSGFNYLEKIVQVPFELPLPERGSLRALFLEQLRGIVGDVDEELLDTEALNAVLTTGLEPLMKTPRDIVRLTNSLRVTYGAVRGEVNVVDFVALEAIRVFEPRVYDRIRARPELFGVVSGLASSFPQSPEEALRAYHVTWCRAIEDAERREAVKQIVARVFPETAVALDARLGIGRARLRRSRAASEPDYFPVYFRFALGDRVVSRELIAALVDPTNQLDALSEGLLALARETAGPRHTRASAMLDELTAQAEEGFDPASVPRIIKSLTSIGDRLWTDSGDTPLDVDNQTRIVWLVGGLLERIDPDDRCATLHGALAEADSLATPALLVRRLLRSLGVPDDASAHTTRRDALDERHALISIDCAMRLERLVARKIASAAASIGLWDIPCLPSLLNEWRRWDTDQAVFRAWFRDILDNDEELGCLLCALAHEEPTRLGMRYRLDPRWLDGYATWSEVAHAVTRLDGVALDDATARARDQYLTELSILQQGDDPNTR